MPKHKQAKDPVPVERKTVAAVSGASVVGTLLAVAVGIQGGVVDVSWLPTWAQSLIGFLVAVVVVAVPTYQAPHTARPDVTTDPAPFNSSNVRVAHSNTTNWDADTFDRAWAAGTPANVTFSPNLTVERTAEPFTGHTDSPYTGRDVVQDPDAPAPKRTTRKAAQA